MSKPDYHAIMTAEVKVDCYAGKDCDQQRKFFSVCCDGEEEDSLNDKKLVINLADLPPGALITVNYPCCPDCGLPREDKMRNRRGAYKIIGHAAKCSCGFDWLNWVEAEYA
jgi:hypothetical protein